MDPLVWAYGLMARESPDGGTRDPVRLTAYREALDLSPAEVQSLAIPWDPRVVPDCPMDLRLDILRAMAATARSMGDAWPDERVRLLQLAERFQVPPVECASIFVAAAGPDDAARAVEPQREGFSLSRRKLLAGGGGALALVAAALGTGRLSGAGAPASFTDFESRFAATLLLVEFECELLLGAGRVHQRSLGAGFFVASNGLFVTGKSVIEPWKFVPSFVQKLDSGYVLDEASIRLRAWRQADVRRALRGRFDEAKAFESKKGSLDLVEVPGDAITSRAAALRGGGVHRGEFHTLDSSNVALLKASVGEPVPSLALGSATELAEDSGRVLTLGLTLPRKGSDDRALKVRTAPGRITPGTEGTFKLKASVPIHCSGGPVLDSDGRAIGVAMHALGDSVGPRCIPLGAIRDAIGLGS